MKQIGFAIIFLGWTLCSCNQTTTAQENYDQPTPTTAQENQVERSIPTDATKDKEEIQALIRDVLNWADSKNSMDLLPMLADNKDSIYVGFDLDKHKQNLQKLKATHYFATEFMDNYNKIILTLDKGLKNGEYEQWLVGDLPPFIFANDVDPWCLCQDVPYDNPKPWDFIEIETLNLANSKGEFNWKWGRLGNDTDPSWKEFKYRFRAVKENGQWKIAYLEGFDFKESTRKDGQL